MTGDREIIAAAVLHDVLEDTGTTEGQLRAQFGNRITDLVLAETENKRRTVPAGETWQKRKEEAITLLQETDDPGVRIVFLGDKLSNMRSLYSDLSRCGDSVWQSFHQKDPKQHHWYYRKIADALCELRQYPAWQEYDRLIRLVFNENEKERQQNGDSQRENG